MEFFQRGTTQLKNYLQVQKDIASNSIIAPLSICHVKLGDVLNRQQKNLGRST